MYCQNSNIYLARQIMPRYAEILRMSSDSYSKKLWTARIATIRHHSTYLHTLETLNAQLSWLSMDQIHHQLLLLLHHLKLVKTNSQEVLSKTWMMPLIVLISKILSTLSTVVKTSTSVHLLLVRRQFTGQFYLPNQRWRRHTHWRRSSRAMQMWMWLIQMDGQLCIMLPSMEIFHLRLYFLDPEQTSIPSLCITRLHFI